MGERALRELGLLVLSVKRDMSQGAMESESLPVAGIESYASALMLQLRIYSNQTVSSFLISRHWNESVKSWLRPLRRRSRFFVEVYGSIASCAVGEEEFKTLDEKREREDRDGNEDRREGNDRRWNSDRKVTRRDGLRGEMAYEEYSLMIMILLSGRNAFSRSFGLGLGRYGRKGGDLITKERRHYICADKSLAE